MRRVVLPGLRIDSKFLRFLFAAVPICAGAQIDYSGGLYTQDFNGLESTRVYTNYTALPDGWVVSKGSYVWTTVTNGYSNNYGTYCFSLAPGDPDKSIGLVIGTTGPAYLGARFRNSTGATLNAFWLGYYAEQWVKGAVVGNDQLTPFSYSLGATSLTAGTYVNMPALDMHSTNDGDGVYAALNGNATRQYLSGTVTGISWLPGQDLWIRWTGISHPFFNSHALAVDDLSFRAVPELKGLTSTPGQLRLAWSTNFPGYALESAGSPDAQSWEAVTNAPAVSGGEYGVEIQAGPEQRFFRLVR